VRLPCGKLAELGFAEQLQRFGYDLLGAQPPGDIAGFFATYRARTSNLDIQAPISVAVGDCPFECLAPAGLDLDRALPNAFERIVARSRLVLPGGRIKEQAREACLAELGNLADRIHLSPSRSYELRLTAVDCNRLPESLPHVAPLLIELYVQLLGRRAQVGQPINRDDAAILLLALREYSRWAGEAVFCHALLFEGAAAILSAPVAQCILDNGDCPQSGEFPLFQTALETMKDCGEQPARPRSDAVTTALLPLLADGAWRTPDIACRQLSQYINPSNGLFGSMKERIWQTYARPLALLVLLKATEALGLQFTPLPREHVQPLSRRTGGAGMSRVERGGRLSAFALRLLEPPVLPAAWKPGRLDLNPLTIERRIAKVMRDSVAKIDGLVVSAYPLDTLGKPVLSVRHDVDRPLTRADLQRVRMLERRLGIRSTWYFKRETFDAGLARSLLDEGCEIGYHATSPPTGDAGFVEQLRAELGDAVAGCSFHGGFGSLYWNGAEAIAQIAALGFVYTESCSEVFADPYEWATERGSIYLVPGSIKVQSRPGTVAAHQLAVFDACGQAIIEDHPDRFDDALGEWLEASLAAGAVAKTVLEHVLAWQAIDRLRDSVDWHIDRDGVITLRFRESPPCQLSVQSPRELVLVEAEGASVVSRSPGQILASLAGGAAVRLRIACRHLAEGVSEVLPIGGIARAT
jgi:hypothetical protein